ncbi:iron ABC transporter permease [Candidatus Fermentibacteria bacterium]|nr:iron ABC transporter permease [Candidatus Fermentibacteria bacterium]
MRSGARSMAILGLVALMVSAGSLFVGPVRIRPVELVEALRAREYGSLAWQIVVHQRLPRIILGFVAGGCLAVAGAAFQGLLGNPLATPYTLGLSGGSALGAVLALWVPHIVGVAGPAPPALLGALITAVAVYLLAVRRSGLRSEDLILAGVTIGFFCSAMVLLVRYLASPHQVVLMDRWLMGGLEQIGFRQLSGILPYAGAGVAMLLACHRELDQVAFGQDLAAGRGVSVPALQRLVYMAGTIGTAAVVSVAGPIAFVGLIVPHTLRRIVGFSHGILLPSCFLGGAVFLVCCDAVARSVLAPAELPVGIITAGIGGPFFLFLLLRSSRLPRSPR